MVCEVFTAHSVPGIMGRVLFDPVVMPGIDEQHFDLARAVGLTASEREGVDLPYDLRNVREGGNVRDAGGGCFFSRAAGTQGAWMATDMRCRGQDMLYAKVRVRVR